MLTKVELGGMRVCSASRWGSHNQTVISPVRLFGAAMVNVERLSTRLFLASSLITHINLEEI